MFYRLVLLGRFAPFLAPQGKGRLRWTTGRITNRLQHPRGNCAVKSFNRVKLEHVCLKIICSTLIFPHLQNGTTYTHHENDSISQQPRACHPLTAKLLSEHAVFQVLARIPSQAP